MTETAPRDEGVPAIQDSTVWILGAGFSKGLGGPLIADLLAHRDKRILESFFPSNAYPLVADELFKARLFYNYGQALGYWDNAEQFLDLVESASVETHAPMSYVHSLLQTMLKGTVRYPVNDPVLDGPGPAHEFISLGDLATACRRALAVDCSLFLRSAQLKSERWSPYVDWARRLGDGHTIVTFNYDHVPELLDTESSTLQVIDPNRVQEDLTDAQQRNRTPVLKVHGSTTWVRDGDAKIRVLDINDASVGDPRGDYVIGVPGPGKRTLIRGQLSRLWTAAVDAIKSARRIIFVGYRFPPTDADARRDLLAALQRVGTQVVTRTVLGPNIESPDSIRLQELLRWTGADVAPIPFLAEDYLTLGP